MRDYFIFFFKAPIRTKLWVLVLAGGGGLVFMSSGLAIIQLARLGLQKAQSAPAAPHLAEVLKAQTEVSVAPIPSFSYSYEIKNVSMPLVDKGATRVAYAQFALVLDCPSSEAKENMKLHRAKLMDTIFEVASRFYVEDFQTPKGFEKFKEALVKAYQSGFATLAPRQVAIQDWFLN